jgi:hypothetical protein
VHSVFYFGNNGGPETDSFHVEVGHFNDSQQQQLYFTFMKAGRVVLCYDSSGFELLKTDTWYHFVGVVGADYNTGFLDGREMVGRHYNVGTAASDQCAAASIRWAAISRRPAKALKCMIRL